MSQNRSQPVKIAPIEPKSKPTHYYYPNLYNRPPRLQEEPVEGRIDIPAPPNPDDGEGRSILMTLLPLAAPLMTGVFYLFISNSTGRNPLYTLPTIAMAVMAAMIGLLTYSQQRWSQRQKGLQALRNYHGLLDRRMARLQAARDLQITLQNLAHPAPQHLTHAVAQLESSVWARRPGDPDFAELRVGVGDVPSAVEVEGPDPDLDAPELRRALRLLYKYRVVENGVQRVNLLQHGSIGLMGSPEDVRVLVYSLLAQLVVHHAPSDVSLYIISSGTGEARWGWAHWLPHTSREGQGGFPDCIAYDQADARLLMSVISGRFEDVQDGLQPQAQHIVVVFDEPTRWLSDDSFTKIIRGYAQGVIAICLGETERDIPPDCGIVIAVKPDEYVDVGFVGPAGTKLHGKGDKMPIAQMESLARQLNGLRLPAQGGVNSIPVSTLFLQLYGQKKIEALNVRNKRWSQIPKEGKLPFAVPIGNIDHSGQQYLDLSDNVHGPHGMIAGTTGAGKSELLRTVVMALAIEHHPYYLNFVMIDFKGGSTFRAFEKLPHTVGTLSNIDGDNPAQARIEALRVLKAIRSENQSRQRFLKQVSDKFGRSITDITAYHQLLETDFDGKIPFNWKPMPHLVIIIDEFAELATDLPDFLPELVSVVRVGRSLGMHLILAMQRPGGYVKEEMRANLQFRICLRVQSPDDSRDMLGRSEAAYLPTGIPGRAYFQAGQSGLIQFQAAQISMDYNLNTSAQDDEDIDTKVVLRSTGREPAISVSRPEGVVADANITKLQKALVDHLIQTFDEMGGAATPPILLPSLPALLDLTRVTEVYQDFHEKAEKMGWNGFEWADLQEPLGTLRAPIGLIDDVASRTMTPLTLNFDTHGSAILIGSPATGKSSALQTIVVTLAQRYRPDLLEMYVIGRGFSRIQGLPQVGAVMHAEETERIRRLLNLLNKVIQERDLIYQNAAVQSFQEYAERAAAPDSHGHPKPLSNILVLIDNFADLLSNGFERSEFVRLIRDGRTYGIYFVITGSAVSSSDIATQLLNLTDQRIAFNLPEKNDIAEVVGAVDERGLDARPGSGLVRTKGRPLPVQIAQPTFVPTTDSTNAPDDITQMIEDLTDGMERLKITRAARDIVTLATDLLLLDPTRSTKELPTSEHQHPLLKRIKPGQLETGFKLPIGIDFDTLEVRSLDLEKEGPHFLIGGSVESGKTTLLKTIALSTAYCYSPQQVQLMLIDLNTPGLNALKGRLPHILASWNTAEEVKTGIPQFITEVVKARKAEVDAAEKAEQKLPRFTPIFVLIDGYDSLLESMSTAERGVMAQLTEIIPQGRQIGVYLFISVNTPIITSLGVDPVIKNLKNRRMAIALGGYDAIEPLAGSTNWGVPRELHTRPQPAGRGFLVTRRKASLMQFARIDHDSARVEEERAILKAITDKWKTNAANND